MAMRNRWQRVVSQSLERIREGGTVVVYQQRSMRGRDTAGPHCANIAGLAGGSTS